MNTDAEVEWFTKEAYGAERIALTIRRPLVLRLAQLAEHVGFDFRAEVLKVNAWCECNKHRLPKRCWDRFWLNCFRRARPDGKQGKDEFKRDVERFK